LVANPQHRCRGVDTASLDGVAVNPLAIPLRDDGATHEVVVVLGEARADSDSRLPASRLQDFKTV